MITRRCFDQNDRIPEKIRQRLVEDCSREDSLTLDVIYGKPGSVFYEARNRMIKFMNSLYINGFNRFEVPFMSVLLTQKCTLRCSHCSDLMPYYSNPVHFSYKEVFFYLKKYLSVVDHVHFLLLCGGETFLYPQLDKVLAYCIREKKIRKIGIVTNGTVMPTENVCKLLGTSKVRVRVSDYDCVKKKREETIQNLEKYGIIIENLKGQKWYDVGGFEKRNRSNRQLQQLFRECSMNRCFEINKSKVIYCARQRSGELGLTPEISRQDYVSLKTRDAYSLRKSLLNMYDKKFLMTCDYCDGITRRSIQVTAGEQVHISGRTP